jgi:alpha-ketoglutarate-dependent taurine dioxygenase
MLPASPLAPFGSVVPGLDLSSPPADEAFVDIATLVHREGVVLFRDQELDEEQQIAFSRGLGELELHPEKLKQKATHPEIFDLSNVREDGRLDDPLGTGTERWHTDSSYREVPCSLSILYAVEVPARGGNTEFANACHAWDRLPADRKAQIERLRVVHSYQHSSPDSWQSMNDEERASVPPVEHPLVRRLADGRRTLYLGSHASHVVGLPLEEGRVLLHELLQHVTAPPGVYQHCWQAGDLLIWDNRVTQHRRTPYRHDSDRRVMRRTTVRGTERP